MSIVLENVSSYFFNDQVLANINLTIEDNTLLAILGPSNFEKKTFLKLFNRLNETQKGYKQTGKIHISETDIETENIYDLRRKVGFVFSESVALPGTVLDNLSFGLNIQKMKDTPIIMHKIEEALKLYKLWSYFENELNTLAYKLHPFKLQILALARALVLSPEVIIFEQPTKFLPEMASRKYEVIIESLKKQHTIIIDTDNMQQARRLSDLTAFIYNGKLIECNKTQLFFTQPKESLTENYIRGKFE